MITVVTIAGMRGEHCKRAVFTALTPVLGIRWADVALGQVTIDHDGTVTETDLLDAIAVTGYVVADVRHDRRVLPLFHRSIETIRI
ncbi:MAG: heavy-metal-associated domain-containing protein [Gemmatimonadaceae bacterium]